MSNIINELQLHARKHYREGYDIFIEYWTPEDWQQFATQFPDVHDAKAEMGRQVEAVNAEVNSWMQRA